MRGLQQARVLTQGLHALPRSCTRRPPAARSSRLHRVPFLVPASPPARRPTRAETRRPAAPHSLPLSSILPPPSHAARVAAYAVAATRAPRAAATRAASQEGASCVALRLLRACQGGMSRCRPGSGEAAENHQMGIGYWDI
eukprot:scaffold1328_cov394-Prasinococcus_capsulatus_cf.AAC.43